MVFRTPTHILKFERYREDYHGTSARMTREFVKRSKFSTNSSDHACGNTLAILLVGRALRRSLYPDSSYIEPRPAAGISCCSLIVEKRSK